MQITHRTKTNYVLNPNFEVDLTYWQAVSGSVIRQSTTKFTGTYAAKLTTSLKTDLFVTSAEQVKASGTVSTSQQYLTVSATDAAKVSEYTNVNNNNLHPTLKPVVSDSVTTSDSPSLTTQANLSGYEKLGSLLTTLPNMTVGKTYIAQAAVNAPAGTTLFIQFNGLKNSGAKTYTATGGWQVIQSLPVIADTTSFALQVGSTQTNKVLYIDAVQVEDGATISPYFDGNYGLGYHWDGAANYSSSYYRAYELEANSSSQVTDYNILISWEKNINPAYQPFTVGTSIITGPDYIPGSANGIGIFGQYQYSDYSYYGYSWSATKNIGQYPYGVMMGTASVQLDNNSNIFSPGYDPTIGDYILPQRPLILSSGYSDIGETVNVFEGLTTSPNLDINERLVTLNAYDFITYLSSITSTTTPDQVNKRADQIIETLLLEAGFLPSQFVLEISLQPTIAYFTCYGQIMTDLFTLLCEAEQGILFCDENGIIRFWNRQHLILNNTVQWSFNYDSMENVTQENTAIINDVIVTANPRAVQEKQDVYSLSEPFLVPAAQQIQNSPQILRNIVVNPSFERDINYWQAPFAHVNYTPGTIAQASGGAPVNAINNLNTVSNNSLVATGHVGSSYSEAVMYSYSGAFNNPDFATSGSNQANYPFVPGTIYQFQAMVKGIAGDTATGYVYWYNNYNLQAEIGGSLNVTLTGGWDRVNFIFTAPDAYGQTRMPGYGGFYGVGFYSNNATSQPFYVDEVSILAVPSTSTNYPYFDGSTPFTSTYLFNWDGEPYDSSSTFASITTISGTYTLTASLNDPTSSVDTPVSAATLSTTTSSFTTNLNADGSGASYNAYVSAINPQTLGGTYKITFQNAWQQPIYITGLELYGTPAKVVASIKEEYSDSTSIIEYGVNPANNYAPLTIANDAIQDDSTAQSLAYSLVTDYGKANSRITIDNIAVPSIQFGDWVEVTFDDVGITQTYVVVGTTITDSANDGLLQTLELEVHNQAKYFQINISAINGTDVISP